MKDDIATRIAEAIEHNNRFQKAQVVQLQRIADYFGFIVNEIEKEKGDKNED